jgi:hypothetical protein
MVCERLISLEHRPSTATTAILMPPLRRPRREPKPDRRRALELLAASRDGATEAIMLAHGFTVPLIVELVCVWRAFLLAN